MENSNLVKFETVYAKYYTELLNFATLKLKDRMIAEDVTANSFIKLYTNYEQLSHETNNIRSLLYKMSMNNILDIYRHKKLSNEVLISDYTDGNGNEYFPILGSDEADTLVSFNSLNEKVLSIVSTFSQKQQQVVELLLYKELSYKEVSEILEIPMSDVKTIIYRCKDRLQKALQTEKRDYQIK